MAGCQAHRVPGLADDNQVRGYVQEIPDGAPRAITPAGVVLALRGAVRDEATVLGQVQGQWSLYPIAGGEPTPVRALTGRDIPLQWSDDGRFIYTMERVAPPGMPSRDVFRVDPSTGRKIALEDAWATRPVGVEQTANNIAIAPNGQLGTVIRTCAGSRRSVHRHGTAMNNRVSFGRFVLDSSTRASCAEEMSQSPFRRRRTSSW